MAKRTIRETDEAAQEEPLDTALVDTASAALLDTASAALLDTASAAPVDTASAALLDTASAALVDTVEHFSLDDSEGEGEEEFTFDPTRPAPNEQVVIRPGDYEDDVCSSDEEEIRNRIGNIPTEWYDEYDHIGYDITGHKVIRQTTKGDQLDQLLDRMDNPDFWRTVHDKTEGKDIVLDDKDLALIQKIKTNKYPDLGYDPYQPYVDFFSCDKLQTPLVDTPERKSAFIPSKHEHKKVMKIVRAMRNGWIKPKEPLDKKPNYYMLWKDDDKPMKDHPMHIPAPKLALPGNAESYNPPAEYLPSPEERAAWESEEPSERSANYLSEKYPCLRHVPAYPNLINERFERCLDLYLCPRKMKMKLNMNPEDLLPKLPKPRDLKPFPTTKAVKFTDHVGPVYSTDVNRTGEFMVSGGQDKYLRFWETSTGRMLSKVELPEVITCVKWNPSQSMVAVCSGTEVYMINPALGDKLSVEATDALLLSLCDTVELEHCKWQPLGNDKHGLRLKIVHNHTLSNLTWHSNGNYMAVTMREGANCSVLIHNIPKQASQKPFSKSKGQIQQVLFHPSKPFFFVLTQRYIRVYNLVKQVLVRKLQTGVRWASCMAIHPKGDNIIVGSYDKTLVWFDMDLSTRPYKSLQQHTKAIRGVAFHPRYPLYATASDDNSVIITHSMVYDDLMKNPLIVPVKVLRAHAKTANYGILGTVFHPYQPWVVSAGADSALWLYV